jgi:GNAT superfamily N-acetyltransferase
MTAHVLSRYDAEVRGWTGTPAPGFRVVRAGPVVRMIGPGPETHGNAVLYADLDGSDADAVIADQVAFFGSLGHAFEWKHYSHDGPADLPERLRAAGFVAQPQETFVALDTGMDVGTRPLPASVRIERLVDPAALQAIATVNGAVYGDPDHAAWLVETILREKQADPDGIDIYAAYERDLPISIGWMRHKAGEAFGSLWGGSTLPEWRGRGVYSALVAVRAARARDRGCRWLTVDCSPMSLPILTRRGFQVLSVITPFVRSPGSPVPNLDRRACGPAD